MFRSYIALARREHFGVSDLGDAIEFEHELLEDSQTIFPTVQRNWRVDEGFMSEVCRARQITEERFFDLMIIPKPSYFENIFYSSQLRRAYGVGTLRFMKEFDKDGNFILDRFRGFYAPRIEVGLITEMCFYVMGKLKQMAA